MHPALALAFLLALSAPVAPPLAPSDEGLCVMVSPADVPPVAVDLANCEVPPELAPSP